MKPKTRNGVVEYWSDGWEPSGAWNQGGDVGNRNAEPKGGKCQTRTTRTMRTNCFNNDRTDGDSQMACGYYGIQSDFYRIATGFYHIAKRYYRFFPHESTQVVDFPHLAQARFFGQGPEMVLAIGGTRNGSGWQWVMDKGQWTAKNGGNSGEIHRMQVVESEQAWARVAPLKRWWEDVWHLFADGILVCFVHTGWGRNMRLSTLLSDLRRICGSPAGRLAAGRHSAWTWTALKTGSHRYLAVLEVGHGCAFSGIS